MVIGGEDTSRAAQLLIPGLSLGFLLVRNQRLARVPKAMRISGSEVVLVTGASGGLGIPICEALARRGVKLAMVAYPGVELDELLDAIKVHSPHSIAFPADLRDPEQRRSTVRRVQAELGSIHILVNNAGVEFTATYHTLEEEQILDVIRVNLEAAMLMTRLVLPDMVKNRRGHIVSMSSLAGKAGPAYQEAYAATKAGLVAFTSSLRATYRNTGVSASVVVPGFVEAGIYAKLKERSGCSAPAILGTSSPQKVVQAVLKVIEKDLPEMIVNPIPIRPLLSLASLSPRFGEWAINMTGGHDFFRRVIEADSQKNKPAHKEAQKPPP
jgi:short-subunit dehydrogenase